MRNLFAALWPNFSSPVEDARLTLWFHPSRISRHISLAELQNLGDEDLAELRAINAGQTGLFTEPQNAYFGLALRRSGLGSTEQGYRDDCVVIPAFTIDIDLRSDKAHKAQNLPASYTEAFEIFRHAPDPTAVVDTGHGLHLTWCFDQPIVLTPSNVREVESQYEQFWSSFAGAAESRHWQLDKTTTVNRVWRIPGLNNYKVLDDVRPVVELHIDASARYRVQDLLQTVNAAPHSRRAPPVAEPFAAGTAHPQNISGEGVSVLSGPPMSVAINVSPELEPIVSRLRRLVRDDSRALMGKILAGESFAPVGSRDIALQRACSIIGWVAHEAPTDLLLEILRPSLETWAAEPCAMLTVADELDKARKKLDRAKRDWSTKNRKALDALRKALGMNEATPEEPSNDAERETRRILRHLVIQYRTAYWVFDFKTERYTSPRIKEELKATMRDCFTADSPVELFYRNEKGEYKEKTVAQLLHEHSTVAAEIVLDLRAQCSGFDPERQQFIEATAPLRPLEARRDPQIERWLELLFGTQSAVLLDWLAALTKLDEQTCAVYIVGPPGVGKGLLAAGIARLWRRAGPTELKHIIGSFNQDVAACPFIFLDEGLPKQIDAQDALRTLVGSSTRTLSRKFLPNAMLEGAIRLLLGANNDNVITFEDAKGLWDVDALVQRFLHVRVTSDAEKYLEAIKLADPGITKRWVNDDLIARHIVWLRENRLIIPGRRFYVEGKERTAMHRKLVTQGQTASLVLEWIVRFLMDTLPLNKHYATKNRTPHAKIGDSGIFVNVQAVIDCWQIYMRQDIRIPPLKKVSDILRSIALSETRLRTDEARPRFYRLDVETIVEWAVEHQLGNEKALRNQIATSLPIEESELEFVEA
jgi:hypothetical protein